MSHVTVVTRRCEKASNVTLIGTMAEDYEKSNGATINGSRGVKTVKREFGVNATHQSTQTAAKPKVFGVGFGIYTTPDREQIEIVKCFTVCRQVGKKRVYSRRPSNSPVNFWKLNPEDNFRHASSK